MNAVLAMTMLESLKFFGVDNRSSSPIDNLKNNFLILGERDPFGINGSFVAPEKRFNINFSKTNTKFGLGLHCNADISYFVNGKEIFKFKADNKKVNFPTQFCLEVYLMDLVLLSLEKYL